MSSLEEVLTKKTEAPKYIKEIVDKTLLRNVESQRAYAIIITSYIDDLLSKVIKTRLVVPVSENDELFNQHGPLYNFGAKLAVAYRMGLISEELRFTLNILRKIRDNFAHTHTELSFEDSRVRDQIDEVWSRLSDSQKVETSEDKFQWIVTGVLILLWNMYSNEKPNISSKQKEPMFR